MKAPLRRGLFLCPILGKMRKRLLGFLSFPDAVRLLSAILLAACLLALASDMGWAGLGAGLLSLLWLSVV